MTIVKLTMEIKCRWLNIPKIRRTGKIESTSHFFIFMNLCLAYNTKINGTNIQKVFLATADCSPEKPEKPPDGNIVKDIVYKKVKAIKM
jgi:hypothetical protein